MTDRELMQQALEALEEVNYDQAYAKEVTALRERLAQPEQEPVAWVYPEGLEALKSGRPWTAYGSNGGERIPLYVAPRQWQGLDDVEIVGTTCECVDDGTFNMDCAMDFARAIEAKLKEKNT